MTNKILLTVFIVTLALVFAVLMFILFAKSFVMGGVTGIWLYEMGKWAFEVWDTEENENKEEPND
jgi:flagellar basal body-associated protein FliL